MNNSILELFHKRNMSDNFKKLNCYQDEAPPDHAPYFIVHEYNEISKLAQLIKKA